MAKKDKKVNSTAMEQTQNNSLTVQANEDEKYNSIVRNKKTIKDLIAPSGIDTSNLNHIAIMSSITRYARSHYVSGLPRMATFPYFLRAMYNFGDINTSVFINPISEATSQNNLNKSMEVYTSMFGKLQSLAPRFNGGPLVKSGPTRGNVRSRGSNGCWRRKRSDYGTKRR
jgi:hypothetical protein